MSDIIRKPEPGDWGRIISMHGEIYSREFGFDPAFEIDIAAKVVHFCKKATEFNRLWINAIGGMFAGSIAISKSSDQTAFINFLIVSSPFRRQGIAQKLLNTALHYAAKHRCAVVRLETYSCLKNARKLYRKSGFNLIESNRNMEQFGVTFDQEFWELKLDIE